MSDNGNSNGRLHGKWRAWTLDANLDEVRAMFERRYGYPPAEIVTAGPLVLAGPIRENDVLQPRSEAQPAQGEISRETAQNAVASPHDVLRANVRQLTLSFEGVAL